MQEWTLELYCNHPTSSLHTSSSAQKDIMTMTIFIEKSSLIMERKSLWADFTFFIVICQHPNEKNWSA